MLLSTLIWLAADSVRVVAALPVLLISELTVMLPKPLPVAPKPVLLAVVVTVTSLVLRLLPIVKACEKPIV